MTPARRAVFANPDTALNVGATEQMDHGARYVRAREFYARELILATAHTKNLTIRQLAQKAGSYSGLASVGTPETIADSMEAWLDGDICDGFNLRFSYLPEGLDYFVDRVVPESQCRGLLRTKYEGATLRDPHGLPLPGGPLLRYLKHHPLKSFA